LPGELSAAVETPHPSHIEADQEHIAILYRVLLALQAELAGFTCLGQGTTGQQVVVVDDLGTNKAPSEIRMNHAGSIQSGSISQDGPGSEKQGLRGLAAVDHQFTARDKGRFV
jgi:hypothetical protein